MQQKRPYLHLTLRKQDLDLTEEKIIEGCQKGDRISQHKLYERFAPVMLGVCYRYVRDGATAEDLLHDGFMTVFAKVVDYRGEGSFEGWCRRVFVTTALGYLRKHNPLLHAEDLDKTYWLENKEVDAVEKMSGKELLKIIDNLPDGYRAVINLYAVEGYSHKEIGEILGISENTSRSQYSRARGRLQEDLKKYK